VELPDHVARSKDIFYLRKCDRQGEWVQQGQWHRGGGPGVGVQDSTNSGEITEDPAPWGRGWVERGESKERGEKAQAGGGRVSGVQTFTVEAFGILQSREGRGG
jgi:hypothetical protein